MLPRAAHSLRLIALTGKPGYACGIWKSCALIAGALISSGFVSQLTRLVKLKSIREVSAVFTSVLPPGCVLWTGYGFYFDLSPVKFFRTVNTLQIILLLALKSRYGKHG